MKHERLNSTANTVHDLMHKNILISLSNGEFFNDLITFPNRRTTLML
jgi:hypothetical protein